MCRHVGHPYSATIRLELDPEQGGIHAQPMQLELPPFSQFSPSLFLLLALGFAAAWAWSLGLLATGSGGVRLLPVWLWGVLLLVAPVVSVPVFLLIGSPPNSAHARRAAALASITALVVTVAVVAIQQIGIMDCRIVHRTGVCEMEPRSTMLPVALGILAAIVVGTFVARRHHPQTPPPLAA